MSQLLHIESSGEICSVCISKGQEVLSLKETEKAFQHTEQITLLIEDCCKEAGITLKELDAISISSGPGSYTALRVGTATAKGICYALDIPLIAVGTLDSLAFKAIQIAGESGFYCPMIDARRMEVYTNVFDEHCSPLEKAQALIVTEEAYTNYRKKGQKIFLFGNGAQKCSELLPAPEFEYLEVKLSALNLIPLAVDKFDKKEFADLAYFSPFYLKSPNITKAKSRL